MFSRNARLFLLGSFLMGVNFEVFQLLLNLYLRERGISEGEIGNVIAGRAGGIALMAIPVALLLAWVRLKPILMASCVVFAGFSLLLIHQSQLFFFVCFSFLAGCAYTFFRVASAPFYMRNSTPKERTYLFSAGFAVLLLSGMAGAIGAGTLVTVLGDYTGDILLGYRYTMILGVMTGLTALIPFSMIKAKALTDDVEPIRISIKQLKERGNFYFKIIFARFLVGVGAGMIIPFLNLYFRDRFGLSPKVIGLFYALVTASMFIGTLAGPLLTRRFGLVRTIVMTELLSIPFMLILAFTDYLPLALIAFVARGGLMNLGVPIGTNFAMELAEKNEQGFVNSLLMISWTGSWMLSAIVGGQMIEEYGYAPTLCIAAGLYMVSSFLYYRYFKDVEVKREDSHGWYIPEGVQV